MHTLHLRFVSRCDSREGRERRKGLRGEEEGERRWGRGKDKRRIQGFDRMERTRERKRV